MPPSLRRRPQQQHQPPPPPPEPFAESDEDDVPEGEYRLDDEDEMGDSLDEGLGLNGDEEEEEDEPLVSPSHPHSIHHDPPPANLREISTLASWTVSSSKPGCSIPQLRHPSTSLFWQSDGPQPHYLNIHFFKLVRIVGLRLYLDFEQDESYTPTRIIFLAGSGMNDLQEWGEMRLESPKGWVWADFSGVGEADSESDDEEEEEEEELPDDHVADDEGPGRGLQEGSESDFENATPRGQTRRRGSPAAGETPINAPEAMNLDPQIPAQRQHQQAQQQTPQAQQPQTTPVPPPPHQHPNPQHHQLQNTPTLNRPTPRLPFASLSENTPTQTPRSTNARKQPKMPVLRAHLVQIKILENHQNGKDTHLRGLQIFARDDGKEKEKGSRGGLGAGLALREGQERSARRGKGREISSRLGRSEWDVEPSIR